MTSEDEFHAKIGAAVNLMSRSATYCGYPIACVSEWIKPPVLLDQILFFRNPGGPLLGYMTWAYLDEATESRLINDPNVLFHLSEWNEGDRLWIMDFVVLNGEARQFVLQALKGLFPNYNTAKSLRRRADGTVKKVVTWRRRV
jgi:cytolysin-activating lysine-acyltransferase